MNKPEAANKALKLWNGRGQHLWTADGWKHTGHVYIAAYNQSDAVRMMKQAGFLGFTAHELRVYFSDGCWGNAMNGITPERGIWVGDRELTGNPVRIETNQTP
jgi:hypothetical protein